jgi:hypothetical protein
MLGVFVWCLASLFDAWRLCFRLCVEYERAIALSSQKGPLSSICCGHGDGVLLWVGPLLYVCCVSR